MTVDANASVVSKIFSELRDIKDRHEKLEQEGPVDPYAGLDKSQVLQESRCFHDANFVKLHPKRCCHHISKLMYFITQGETFTASDTTSVRTGARCTWLCLPLTPHTHPRSSSA